MSFSNWFMNKLTSQIKLSDKDFAMVKYGCDVLYINFSKTFILFICAVVLGILRETAFLLCIFSCVRATGFGYHSNNTVKCTIIGLIEFIGFTYVAILSEPFSITISCVVYLICMMVFLKWAPVETAKRPIRKQRKRLFKVLTLAIATSLFVLALWIGHGLYRNLIIMGVLMEAVCVLPPMKKIIL